jgi:hypothetical protein
LFDREDQYWRNAMDEDMDDLVDAVTAASKEAAAK